MTQRNDQIALRHMLDHAREAVDMAVGKTRDDLESHRMLQLALTRLTEIVGEAATRVSPATRQRWPNIPWPQIIGVRNRLVHGYDAVDLDILWDIVKIDFPHLITELENTLGEMRDQQGH